MLLVQLSHETREQRWLQFLGFSFLSRLVLITCVRNVEPCFYPSPCLSRSVTESVLNHDRLCHICCLSSVHKSRSVVKCFLGVRRTGSRAVLLLAHQDKCCVFSHPFICHLLVFSPGYIAPCPLGKLCQEQVCLSRSEARESAHSEQCESVSESLAHSASSARSCCLVLPRTL